MNIVNPENCYEHAHNRYVKQNIYVHKEKHHQKMVLVWWASRDSKPGRSPLRGGKSERFYIFVVNKVSPKNC